jgi:hypothetical protein
MFKALVRTSAIVTALVVSPIAAADDALRMQQDVARERVWVLTARGVTVLDSRTRRTLAVIRLPEWTWAAEGYSCPPELALGPTGEAVVSSNVVPTLWRIDPVSFAVTRHMPALDAHTDKDVGFTGLVFSKAQGAFYAVSDFGALWRIDPQLRRAQQVDLPQPMPRACGVAVRTARSGFSRFFGLCVRGPGGGWTVNVAPDRRSGYVIEQACGA